MAPGGDQMTVAVPLLTKDQVDALPSSAGEVVDYRKSGLSHGLWDQRQPRALMSDAEAVERLVGHRYFRPHVTPLQLFNRATDPFLAQVKNHTFAVIEDLDRRGLRNHLLVITRCKVSDSDCERLATI